METLHLYEQISKNKRDSWLLMSSVILIICILGYVMGRAAGSGMGGLTLALIFAPLYGVVSYFMGDVIVMMSLGAKGVTKADYPQLYNVVEEMSIAAGLPIPYVLVIDSKASNAFATGISPQKASITVTKGLLEILNREELQAVIAHEMGHIKNFDTRFAVLMAVMVGAIALMCDTFLRVGGNKDSSSDSDDAKGQLLFLILGLLLSILAPIAANLIQLAMSRRRELLADNTSAELTRNPAALANALEKIAMDLDPLTLTNRGAQHLFIINPLNTVKNNTGTTSNILTDEKTSWHDTHPPLALRLRLLREMSHSFETPKTPEN